MFATAVGRLRWIALIEGVSYLVLLGIAMPLKYFADLPIAVKITGWMHGVLFVAFGFALLQAWQTAKWKLGFVIAIFVSALIPLGTFFMDPKLQREMAIADE